MNEAIARAENLDRELNTQKEILKQMEMTKKEYIQRLKKELDTIELRYQHLLNENIMIGEDFRSRARENLLYSTSLEQRIEELEQTIKEMQNTCDIKDENYVILGRECENYQMVIEEYLTHFSLMRDDRDNLKEVSEKFEKLTNQKQK